MLKNKFEIGAREGVETMDEKIIKKLTDEKFVKKIIELKSRKEVKKVFESEGIEISDKEIDELGKGLYLIIKKTSELPKKDLEKISGGTLTLTEFTETNHGWEAPLAHHCFSAPGMYTNAFPTSESGGVLYNAKGVAVAGAVAGIIAAGVRCFSNSNKTSPVQPKQQQPFISNETLAVGAVVVATATSTYGLIKLIQRGWFSN